ncbi:MAG: hypothetical protein U1F12_11180 [Pseudomonadales bacterium]|jgi:hypothetical protein
MKYLVLIAFSLDKNGNFRALGAGTKSCGAFVEDYQEDGWGKLINSAWVGGYFTAINEHLYLGENVANETDSAARNLLIYNYCKQNPLDSLQSATSYIFKLLLSR